MKEYFEDDRAHWRDTCKGMTRDEIKREIKKLEKEVAKEKTKIEQRER